MKPIEALFLLSTLKAAERATAVTEDSFHSFTWAGKRDSTKYLMSQESGALIWRRTKWRAKWRFIATDCHRAQERNLLDKKKSSLLLQDCSSVSVGVTLFGSAAKWTQSPNALIIISATEDDASSLSSDEHFQSQLRAPAAVWLLTTSNWVVAFAFAEIWISLWELVASSFVCLYECECECVCVLIFFIQCRAVQCTSLLPCPLFGMQIDCALFCPFLHSTVLIISTTKTTITTVAATATTASVPRFQFPVVELQSYCFVLAREN